MAITTTTISRSAGFARSDLITQVEEAFTWLGWHGDTRTGIVTFIDSYSGGGTVGAVGDAYEDVFPVTTTGIGTGASFYVTRSSGVVNGIRVNRPGYGYTDGEYVTLSAADIGGSANGAVAIGITVKVAGNQTPTGYGSTTSFYDFDKSGTQPWGVVRHTIQQNKKYGDTYRGFQITSGSASAAYNLSVASGNGFHPWDVTNTSNRGNYYSNRFTGKSALDVPLYSLPSSNNYYYTNSSSPPASVADFTLTSVNGNSYNLDLTIFRSSIDPNFAVFSYRQPTLSSTVLSDNTFSTFFFHNFTTNIWNLDELFLGGLTHIIPVTGNTSSPTISFRSWIGGNVVYTGGNYYASVRSGEFGYIQSDSTSGRSVDGIVYVESYYESNAYPQNKNQYNSRIYRRNNTLDGTPVGTNSDFNAVIKGIPLNSTMVPCPYYIPDDFVLIDFDYATPSANIQQGDTITISGSEVYTVITGSYNQTTRTRGILFCARTV
jgi:hypothetical protein